VILPAILEARGLAVQSRGAWEGGGLCEDARLDCVWVRLGLMRGTMARAQGTWWCAGGSGDG
jgi:hypothetical protein